MPTETIHDMLEAKIAQIANETAERIWNETCGAFWSAARDTGCTHSGMFPAGFRANWDKLRADAIATMAERIAHVARQKLSSKLAKAVVDA